MKLDSTLEFREMPSFFSVQKLPSNIAFHEGGGGLANQTWVEFQFPKLVRLSFADITVNSVFNMLVNYC